MWLGRRRRNCERVIPFFAFAPELRKILYTTNAGGCRASVGRPLPECVTDPPSERKRSISISWTMECRGLTRRRTRRMVGIVHAHRWLVSAGTKHRWSQQVFLPGSQTTACVTDYEQPRRWSNLRRFGPRISLIRFEQNTIANLRRVVWRRGWALERGPIVVNRLGHSAGQAASHVTDKILIEQIFRL